MTEASDYVKVKGYRGIAFAVVERGECELKCRMVGDDAVHTFDVSECTPLTEDEFCHECGQLGCGHGRPI